MFQISLGHHQLRLVYEYPDMMSTINVIKFVAVPTQNIADNNRRDERVLQ